MAFITMKIESWKQLVARQNELHSGDTSVVCDGVSINIKTPVRSGLTVSKLVELLTILSPSLEMMVVNIRLAPKVSIWNATFPILPHLTVFHSNIRHTDLLPFFRKMSTISPSLQDIIIGDCRASGRCPLHQLVQRTDRYSTLAGPISCIVTILTKIKFTKVTLTTERRSKRRPLVVANPPEYVEIQFTCGMPRVLSSVSQIFVEACAVKLVEVAIQPNINAAAHVFPWHDILQWWYELTSISNLRRLDLDLTSVHYSPFERYEMAKSWMEYVHMNAQGNKALEKLNFSWRGRPEDVFEWSVCDRKVSRRSDAI